MALYRNLDELIRDGMEVKFKCRRCVFAERVDATEVRAWINGRLQLPFGKGDPVPNYSLEGAANVTPCPVCGGQLVADAVRPLPQDDDDDE